VPFKPGSTALVLSGSIGAGHDTVAEACSEALARVNIEATTVDCMGLLSGWPQRIGDFVFQKMAACCLACRERQRNLTMIGSGVRGMAGGAASDVIVRAAHAYQ
jgi:hypothetical protein